MISVKFLKIIEIMRSYYSFKAPKAKELYTTYTVTLKALNKKERSILCKKVESQRQKMEF